MERKQGWSLCFLRSSSTQLGWSGDRKHNIPLKWPTIVTPVKTVALGF